MTANPSVIDGHILLVDDRLTVSFQRYPENVLQGAAEVPRSYGAVPVELASPKDGILPIRQGEGIWLGLSPQGQRECAVRVRIGWLDTHGADDVPLPWSSTLSSLQLVHGLHKSDGSFYPFIRAPLSRDFIPCAGIVISVKKAEAVRVRFLSVPEFEVQAGRLAPRPIAPDDAYGGWRLP